MLDEEALAEERARRRKERTLDVRPKSKPDSRKWMVLSVLLIIVLLICFGHLFARACSLGSRSELGTANNEPSAGLRE